MGVQIKRQIILCMYIGASTLAQLVNNTPANAGDTRDKPNPELNLIPGLERSPGEGNAPATQYSWASW